MRKIFNFLNGYILFRYLVSGCTAASVDLALLYLFNITWGLQYLLAAILAFILAFFISFSLQKFWTFQDRNKDGIHKQAGVYFIVSITGLLLNTFLIYVFAGLLNLHIIIAQILAGVFVAVSNFFFYRYFVFKYKEPSLKGFQNETTNIYPKS